MSKKSLKPDEPPIIQGYLFRQSGTGLLSSRGIQKKWCCLYRPFYFYIFDREDSNVSQGIFDLRDVLNIEVIHKKKKKEVQFYIHLHTTKKTEVYMAISHDDGEKWVLELRAILKSLKLSDNNTNNDRLSPEMGGTQLSVSLSTSVALTNEGYGGTSMSSVSHAPSTSTTNNWVIDSNEVNFDEGKVLGKGSFGCVHLATWRGSPVAVKTLFGNVGAASDDFFHELAMLCRLHHPNIVQLLGYCSSGSGPMAQQCLVTEYLPGGSLNQFLNDLKSSGKGLDFRLLLNIAMDTCKGMMCLHAEKPPIIHRDLKSANILIASVSPDAAVNAKVADFGIATEHQQTSEHTKHQGTFIYMAPEVFNSEKYTTKVDVFSFGLILWEMCSLERPWKEYKFQFQIEEAIVKGLRPVIPSFVPDVLKSIIVECWSNSPDNRPEFSAVLRNLKKIPKEQPSWPAAPQSSPDTTGGTPGTVVVGVGTAQPSHGEFADTILHNLYDAKESTTWTEFCNECSKVLHARQTDLVRIKPIVCDEAGNVTKRSYINFLKWFSPLNQEDDIYEESSKPVTGGISISEIKALLNTQWFHGIIDANTTISRLQNQASGTYLIRFSGSEPGNYALSLNDNGKIRHWKIVVSKTDSNPSYTINNKSFPSLNAIVGQTNFEFLETKLGAAPELKYPCPKNEN